MTLTFKLDLVTALQMYRSKVV